MKKFLAILMTLVMLMSTCAFAEATEAESAKIVLDDIVLYEGDTALIDLSGIGLSLSAYNSETPGLQLGLTASDEEVAGLSVAVDGTKLLLGMTGVSNAYSVDIVDVVELFAVDAGLIADPETEDMASIISEEDQLALAELIVEAVSLYEASAESSTEELDGTTYDITSKYISMEDMDGLLKKAIAILDNYPQLAAGAGVESFAQMYEALAPALSFGFTTYSNETEFNFQATVMSIFTNGTEEEGFMLEINVKNVLSDESTVDTQVEVLVAHNEEEYTLAFNMQFVDNNDSSWMPSSETAIDLFEALADEEHFNTLMTEIVNSGIVALAAVAESNETVAALLEAVPAE